VEDHRRYIGVFKEMSNCYRCGREVPEPDFKESLAREEDWRHEFEGEYVPERVLICIPCSDELDHIQEGSK
jgi:DNA-directed RNA polymerase subunit RPC12/RpoP